MKGIFQISLTPGFSRVAGGRGEPNRFSGFRRAGKPLKRLEFFRCDGTGLKPGVNERPLATRRVVAQTEIGSRQLAIGNRKSE